MSTFETADLTEHLERIRVAVAEIAALTKVQNTPQDAREGGVSGLGGAEGVGGGPGALMAHEHEWIEVTTYADRDRRRDCTRCGATHIDTRDDETGEDA